MTNVMEVLGSTKEEESLSPLSEDQLLKRHFTP